MKGDGGKETEPRADERRADIAANVQEIQPWRRKPSLMMLRVFLCEVHEVTVSGTDQ